ncbi:hypothetical protein BDF20DRAFT_816914 [Mycotypha africana]|uniref:uncharacterized protein n=1 Tax=Mycotypha africana TaxID=64632 RepID=UPI0023013C79|nr:uncharacterized protein BDF20DRAFT_816914 [Mycotypha africana]KAI8984042.1 hypothetical protein BDF20DRAFT_816914 [Mycotypha africana]
MVPPSHGHKDPAVAAAAKKMMNNKRIVIVGVHGWFPMKLVRSMIGEPTGTSIKFCEQMATGIKQYFQEEHGVDLPLGDVVTLVPLEGEGKVEDRVHQLYEKLLNNSAWLEAVSSADVILWATHSQGTPVSMMLLRHLLERGHIHLIRQSVCLLAMAGISQGPFPALKGSLIVKYFEADAARELFEFMDSSSPISVQFRTSLAYILHRGVKVVLTGSMQDQVVPLYSAIMTSIDHPNLLRSIYIDGHLLTEKNDFLIHLVVFAVKLRNWGLSDHNLVVHLSEVLAGSLYALEGGHSTIYEELEVYMTAVKYTFETAPFGQFIRKTAIVGEHVQQAQLSVEKEEAEEAEEAEVNMTPFVAKQQQNPFYLPWILHGIMTDPQVLANASLVDDLKQLLQLFEQWHPTSARLKELKYRLDPIRTVRL